MSTSIDTPKISILTPSFRYGRFIGDAIESTRLQACSGEVEHIVMDAGSTDETLAVLKSAPGVIWRSEPDEGQSDALNKALRIARGEIVGWLNADEFYHRDAFEAVLTAFEDPSVGVVYGDASFVDVSGRHESLAAKHRFSRLVLREYGCYISTCSFFVRRELLEADPWDTSSRYVMDWDLFLKLEQSGTTFRYVPVTLGAFRVHDSRVTAVPLGLDDPERRRVMDRYQIPPMSRMRRLRARALHLTFKVLCGSKFREVRSRPLRGSDERWWRVPSP